MILDAGEAQRLAALHALELMDSDPETQYTELVELAAEICAVPMSMISLIDRRRQWFKAKVGLPMSETDPELSVCSHTIQQEGLLEIQDLMEDTRFRDNPEVGESGVRFYAGIPLTAGNEHAVGTLCVMDVVPRVLSAVQRHGLEILGRQAETLLECRLKQKMLENLSQEKDRLTHALEAKNRMFAAFMDHAPFLSFIKDGEGRFAFYNEHFHESFGVVGDAWIGKTVHELFPVEMADKYRDDDQQVMRGGVPIVREEYSPGLEGKLIAWRSYKFPIMDEHDVPMLGGVSLNVTEENERRVLLENALKESQDLSASLTQSHAMLRTLLENNPNQCYLKAEDGRYLFYNRKFAEHFGIDEKKWLGRTDHELVPLDLAERLRAHDLIALNSDGVVETVGDLTGAEGTHSTFRVLKFRCTDQDGNRMLAGMAVDITGELERENAMKRAFVELEEIASVDGLTALANRRTFDIRLAAEYARADAAERPLSLLILDIDNFKLRNDRYGHAAGDQALRMVGAALLQCCRRKGDMAARVGGEEFAFLLPETTCAEAEMMAERVLKEIRSLPCESGPLTVSVGVASMNATTRSGSRLYNRADDAMYTAKRTGKDRAVVHSAHLNSLLEDVAQDLSLRMSARDPEGQVAVRWAS